VIADLDKIPWSHPLHLWSSIPWTEIKDTCLFILSGIAKVIVVFSAIFGLAIANTSLAMIPLLTLASFRGIAEIVQLLYIIAVTIPCTMLIELPLLTVIDATWQETFSVIGSLTYKVTITALAILIAFGAAHGLILLANPFIPAIALSTGYAPELLAKAVEITVFALANIGTCHAVYQNAVDIYNDEFQRV